jgi:hypothetical protein
MLVVRGVCFCFFSPFFAFLGISRFMKKTAEQKDRGGSILEQSKAL